MAEIINFDDYKETLDKPIIKKSQEVGENLAFDLMNIEPEGTDNTGILFSVWNHLTIALMLRGWTSGELRNEVTDRKKEYKDIKENY
jgi:hypothetical protein|tara:strand:+ start:154 stop:414 length:261 start_codon:yes stop_codon:yes gene_type:complete